jgi:hypothetical protein
LSSRPSETFFKKFRLRLSFSSSCFGLGAFFTGRFEKAIGCSVDLSDAFSWSEDDMKIPVLRGLAATFALRGESGDGMVGRKAL